MMLKKHLTRIVLIVILVSIYSGNLFREQIPVNNGWGWDGKHYAYLTIHFEEMASQKSIDSYQYQRILTPALIHYGCKWTGIVLNDQTVLSIYGYYNLLLLIIGAILYFGWCNRLKVSKPIEIAGFAALFLNYFVLKNTPYYPILTDPTAFVIGILLMYWISTRNTTGKWLLAVLGQFVFPLFHVVTLPLILLPKGNRITQWLQKYQVFTTLKWITLVVFFVAACMIIFLPNLILPVKYQMVFTATLLPISGVCVLVYLWQVFQIFQKQPIIEQPSSKPFPFVPFMMLLLAWGVGKVIVLQNSIPEEGFTPVVFGLNLVQQTLDFPLSWLVAHITYFGPAVIVFLLWGRTLFHQLFKQPDGIILFAFFSILLMIGSESRQFIYCWPFWAWMLLQLLSSLQITLTQAIAFAMLCLVQSKCWFPINVEGNFADYDYSSFPEQRYFMNHGPFMSDASYWINAIAAIAAALFTWVIFCFRPSIKIIEKPIE
jgi:hypothetical protein